MSIDGIMLAAIKHEFKEKLIGARIDKIYQIQADLISMTLRQKQENLKLLISINPQYSRIQLTELSFENPKQAPAFAMLLRKYLMRAYITDIKQLDLERILQIELKSSQITYTLIAEIMGRYSNLILLNEKGQILDALKRINANISRQREVYPGINYQYPPKQDKLNPLLVKEKEFFQQINTSLKEKCFQAILTNFQGIGPNIAKEIVWQANLDLNKKYQDLNQTEKKRLGHSFNSFFTKIKNHDFIPTIALDINKEIAYISALPLSFQDKISQEINFTDTSKLFDYYYQYFIKTKQIRQLKQELMNTVKNFLKKNSKQLNKFQQRLSEGQKAEEYKKKGDLITANIYQIKKGVKKVELLDYYDPKQETITIKLNPELSPPANAQKYYKKYTKAKKSIKHTKREIGKLKHEKRYLEQLTLNIEQGESKVDLVDIKEELREEGYLKQKQNNKKKNKKNNNNINYLKFKSKDGYDIFVGKNNKQNDYLTKRLAHNNDLWLHIKDLAGSHVIIRRDTNKDIPSTTLLQAAALAAYYSKGRMSENVAIDYTEIKNVNKPKGAKPGLVYYENYQTVYVNPSNDLNKEKNEK